MAIKYFILFYLIGMARIKVTFYVGHLRATLPVTEERRWEFSEFWRPDCR
jgi:hypothetical protein